MATAIMDKVVKGAGGVPRSCADVERAGAGLSGFRLGGLPTFGLLVLGLVLPKP